MCSKATCPIHRHRPHHRRAEPLGFKSMECVEHRVAPHDAQTTTLAGIVRYPRNANSPPKAGYIIDIVIDLVAGAGFGLKLRFPLTLRHLLELAASENKSGLFRTMV